MVLQSQRWNSFIKMGEPLQPTVQLCKPSLSNLGEQPPPLPVPQLEVSSTVPLDDSHGRLLLLPLSKSSGISGRNVTSVLPSCKSDS